MKKGLGRGGIRWKANRVHWRTRSGGNPTPEHPQPGHAEEPLAPEPGARARGRRRTRTRTRSRSPARAAPAPARAHLRPPLCVSSIRYVQNGPSAAAAAPSGRGRRRGGGGGAQVWRRGRGGPGGGKLGRGAGGGTLGGRSLPSLPPSPPPLSVAPYFKAIPASLLFSCSDVQEPSRPRGVFSVLSPAQNPGPKPKKEPVLLSTLPSFCPDHIPRLLCEMTQKQTLSHSALHDDGVPKRCCNLTLLSLTPHLEEGERTGWKLESSPQHFQKRKPRISHANIGWRKGLVAQNRLLPRSLTKSMSKGASVWRVPL